MPPPKVVAMLEQSSRVAGVFRWAAPFAVPVLVYSPHLQGYPQHSPDGMHHYTPNGADPPSTNFALRARVGTVDIRPEENDAATLYSSLVLEDEEHGSLYTASTQARRRTVAPLFTRTRAEPARITHPYGQGRRLRSLVPKATATPPIRARHHHQRHSLVPERLTCSTPLRITPTKWIKNS